MDVRYLNGGRDGIRAVRSALEERVRARPLPARHETRERCKTRTSGLPHARNSHRGPDGTECRPYRRRFLYGRPLLRCNRRARGYSYLPHATIYPAPRGGPPFGVGRLGLAAARDDVQRAHSLRPTRGQRRSVEAAPHWRAGSGGGTRALRHAVQGLHPGDR